MGHDNAEVGVTHSDHAVQDPPCASGGRRRGDDGTARGLTRLSLARLPEMASPASRHESWNMEGHAGEPRRHGHHTSCSPTTSGRMRASSSANLALSGPLSQLTGYGRPHRLAVRA